MYLTDRSFPDLFNRLPNMFRVSSYKVEPARWQGVDVSKKPEMVSYELMNFDAYLSLEKNEHLIYWRDQVKPNLPWADDHFAERVCGFPLNPGLEYKNWPWGKNSEKFLDEDGKFNHNYMERYWPKHGVVYAPTYNARDFQTFRHSPPPVGLHAKYGDMMDMVRLLAGDPSTRQAYIPIFFPEDTGKLHSRKPCTLGYQFRVLNDQLHVWYPMRSCDAIRHLADDIYLTIRLLLWVLEQCRELDPTRWAMVRPGTFGFHATSLHIFKNDWPTYIGGDAP